MVTPIARLTSEYLVVVVPASSPYKTMADLVAAFKADPGKVSWHGGSAGGSDHILAGLIAKAVGGSQQNISKHLAWLHDEAFLSRRKRGTSTLYEISDPQVIDLCERICAAIAERLEPAPSGR